METMQLSANRSLQDLLKCPFCMEFMLPPVYQCASGHLLCSNCKMHASACPTCEDEMIDIRCLHSEKFMEYFEFPCKYKTQGCNTVIPYTSGKLQHEEACRFRPYECLYWKCNEYSNHMLRNSHGNVGSCTFQGENVTALIDHLREFHGSPCYHGNVVNALIRCGPKPSVSIFNCLGNSFCLCCVEILCGVFLFVALMGEESEARDFRYELEVGDDTFTLSSMAVVQSIREMPKLQLGGLVVPIGVADHLNESKVNNARELLIRGGVWKVVPDGNSTGKCKRHDRGKWKGLSTRRPPSQRLR